MISAFDVITQGVDTSGRKLTMTRQSWQFYGRVNERIGGILVLIQGGWSFADASGNTHAKAMCTDYRSWNLVNELLLEACHYGRDLMGTMWYRTEDDGFDPHIHNNLLGDSPAAMEALKQVTQYRAGLNGLANMRRDRDPYRPKKITSYAYQEEDMTPEQDARLARIEKMLEAEKTRDQREAERDKARFERLVTMQGNLADELTVMINRTKDTSTKTQLKKLQEKVLLGLKNDPDVTQKDNPSDDGLAERNMG